MLLRRAPDHRGQDGAPARRRRGRAYIMSAVPAENATSAPLAVGRQITRGAAWMVGMRWLMRGIGLISTVVVARVLSPDDYGVMAMSAVVVELLMMFGETNVDIALLREPGS